MNERLLLFIVQLTIVVVIVTILYVLLSPALLSLARLFG